MKSIEQRVRISTLVPKTPRANRLYIAFVRSNEHYILSTTQEVQVTHCFRCLQLFKDVGGPLIAENCVLKDSLRREITYFRTNSDRTLATSVLKTVSISTQTT